MFRTATSTSARFVLAVVCLHLPTPSAAQAADGQKVTLRYKFELGEVLRYEVDHQAHVKSTIEETSQEVESTTESVKAWKVTDVLPSGEIEFMHVVESARMINRRPKQGVAEYDSRETTEPPPFFAEAAKSIGVPLTQIRMTPAGKIVDREEKHPQPKVSEDMPITLELPAEPIAVGEKWSRTYDITADRKSGAKQKIRSRRLCQLKAVEAGVAVIEVDYQILTPVDAFVKSQLVERLTSGVVRFDIERGRIISQRHEVDERILGFAGKASSMHFVARLEERLLEKVAGRR